MKLRTGKVAYTIQGQYDVTGYPPGTAFICAAHTAQIETVLGHDAVVCLADGTLMLCEISKGTRSQRYNLSAFEKLVMRDALIRWAEPIVAALSSGEWRRIERGNAEEYLQMAACHPVPVLHVGEAGRATFADQRMRA